MPDDNNGMTEKVRANENTLKKLEENFSSSYYKEDFINDENFTNIMFQLSTSETINRSLETSDRTANSFEQVGNQTMIQAELDIQILADVVDVVDEILKIIEDKSASLDRSSSNGKSSNPVDESLEIIQSVSKNTRSSIRISKIKASQNIDPGSSNTETLVEDFQARDFRRSPRIKRSKSFRKHTKKFKKLTGAPIDDASFQVN